MFQKKNVAVNFITKLLQAIHGWKNEFFFVADGQQMSAIAWNRKGAFYRIMEYLQNKSSQKNIRIGW